MEHGNTTASVSPMPTESEMNAIRQIFERSANAIVQASELSHKVTELVATVDKLKADMDEVQKRNAWLDESLANVRKQRDEASAEASKLRLENASCLRKIDDLVDVGESQGKTIDQLRSDLSRVIGERDDYGLQAMKLSDDLALANSRLAKFKAVFEDEPKPEPVPVKSEPAQANAAGVAQGSTSEPPRFANLPSEASANPVGAQVSTDKQVYLSEGEATQAPAQDKPWWEQAPHDMPDDAYDKSKPTF